MPVRGVVLASASSKAPLGGQSLDVDDVVSWRVHHCIPDCPELDLSLLRAALLGHGPDR